MALPPALRTRTPVERIRAAMGMPARPALVAPFGGAPGGGVPAGPPALNVPIPRGQRLQGVVRTTGPGGERFSAQFVEANPQVPQAGAPEGGEGTTPPSSQFLAAAAAAGLRPNFSVVRLPGQFSRGGSAVSEPIETTFRRLPATEGVAGVGELAAAIETLRSQGWDALTPAERGALAGAAVALIFGQWEAVPLAAGLGATIQQVTQLFRQLGITPSQVLSKLLGTQPAPQNAPYPIGSQPGGIPPTSPPPAPVAQPGGRGLIPGGQRGLIPREPVIPPGGQPVLQPLPTEKPCPNCPPQQQPQGGGDCSQPDSQIGQLARQLVNCPTFQRELQEKFEIRGQQGERPQLVPKEPLCICFDSEGDYQTWLNTGGRAGGGTIVRGVEGTIIGPKE